MRLLKKCLLILLIIIILCLHCSAHGGKTDSAGGHYDSNTGEYHYHHGYPAHQHTNGECPYDFKNNENSYNSYNNSDSLKTTKAYTKKAESTTKTTSNIISDNNKTDKFGAVDGELVVEMIVCALFILFFVAGLGVKAYDYFKQKLTITKSKKEAKEFLKNHQQEIINIKKQLSNLKQQQTKLISQYSPVSAYKVLENTPGVPSDAFFNENKNIITSKTDFPMTVYRSFSGECFHCVKGHGNSSIPMYIFDAAKKYYPCKICAKSFCNYEWYNNVYDTIYFLEGFGIEIEYLDRNSDKRIINKITEKFLQICSAIITKYSLPLYPSCHDFVIQECMKYIELQKSNLLSWNCDEINIKKAAYALIADICYIEIEFSEDFICDGKLSHDSIGCNLYYLYKNIQNWASENNFLLSIEKTKNILTLKSLIENDK